MPRPKSPKVGTIEWQLWKLKAGESYTRVSYLPMEKATPNSLSRAKTAARSYFTNYFKGLRDEYGKKFITRQYTLFDEVHSVHVIVTVITSNPDAYKCAEDDDEI